MATPTLTLTLPSTYGLVLLTTITSFLLTLIHSIPIGTRYRPAAKITYPQLYATPEQEAADPSGAVFAYNCAQRAHANYVENLTPTVISMLIGGLSYPRAAAGLGAGWIVFRLIYLRQYVRTKKGTVRHGKPPPGIGTTFWLFQYALYGLGFKGAWDVWSAGRV